jgi:hypothetical protein
MELGCPTFVLVCDPEIGFELMVFEALSSIHLVVGCGIHLY